MKFALVKFKGIIQMKFEKTDRGNIFIEHNDLEHKMNFIRIPTKSKSTIEVCLTLFQFENIYIAS